MLTDAHLLFSGQESWTDRTLSAWTGIEDVLFFTPPHSAHEVEGFRGSELSRF